MLLVNAVVVELFPLLWARIVSISVGGSIDQDQLIVLVVASVIWVAPYVASAILTM
jgi:hypothetical protein